MGGLFGGGQKESPAPVVPPPVVMPTPDDEAIRKKKLRESQRMSARQGRESTMLSDDADETLG